MGKPLRLYLLEISGMALGLATVIAIALLIVRRAANDRVATVTSVVDWFLLAALLLQVATGVYIAFTLRWGSVWYLHTATPWLWSLVKLDPQVQYLAVLPTVVKLHAVNAFFLVAIFPFSRLVHVVSVPLSYLARPYQVVIWCRRPTGR
jgi:nitrate reductase gamma subunit